MILDETIAEDLRPLRKGGITFYPAAALQRIFDWAQHVSRRLEWVEGVFYNLDTDEGQLSLSYICEHRAGGYASFREACLSMVSEMEAEAAVKGMGAYFEIGISN